MKTIEPGREPHFHRQDWRILGLLLLAGVLLRLPDFNTPQVDFLSWRGTQTLMVARNFVLEGMNLFSPSVDWRTTHELAPKGTVGGTELFLVPYATAVLYHVFGMHYWVDRVVPLCFALLGTSYFFRLIRGLYGRWPAAWGALLLTVSPYFWYTGRMQMPESFVFAMSFATLYHFDRWLYGQSWRSFVLALVSAILMLLGKPPIAILALCMGGMALLRFGVRTPVQPALYLFAAISGLVFSAYLYYSYRVLLPKTGLSFSQPTLLDYGRWLLNPEYYTAIAGAVWWWAVTPPVLLLAAAGLAIPLKDRRDALGALWCVTALAFFLLMPGGNRANGYYHMILAPPCIVLAVRVLMRIDALGRPGKAFIALVLLGCTAYSSTIAHRLWQPYHEDALHCGLWLRENTPKDSLVLTESDDPTTLYFSERVGWTSWAEHHGQPTRFTLNLVEKTRKLGASVLAVTGTTFDNAFAGGKPELRDTLLDKYACHAEADFSIYFLTQPPDLTLPADRHVRFGEPASRTHLRGSWSAPQLLSPKAGCVVMGPGKRAGLVFKAPEGVRTLNLELSTPLSGQTLSVRVGDLGSAPIPMPAGPEIRTLQIPLPPQVLGAVCQVHLQALVQNEAGESILLHGFSVE